MPERTLLHPEGYSSIYQRSRETKKRYLLGRSITYLILGLWTLFTFYSISWMMLASLKTNREIFTRQFLPTKVQLSNYVNAFTTLNFGRYLLNSIMYISISVAILILISAQAAYILSRTQFRGRRQLTTLVTSGMGIPSPLLFIPLFTLFIRLHVGKSILGLIITYISVSIPFTVFLLTAFFVSLPKELEEAALIDGCSPFQVYWRVMFPLAQPGIVTAVIFNFIGMWKEYTWALIFVNDPKRSTLSLGLYSLKTAMQYSANWAGLYAGVVIVMVPTILLYIFLSEKIISGITMGSVK